jgi:hypothetical protein
MLMLSVVACVGALVALGALQLAIERWLASCVVAAKRRGGDDALSAAMESSTPHGAGTVQAAELVVSFGYHASAVATLAPRWWSPLAAIRADPTYGFDPVVFAWLHVYVGFELWSLANELVKARGPLRNQMVAHHLATLLVGVSCIGDPPFLHGHTPFYVGCASLSNVPLCVYYAFRTFPALKTRYPRTREVTRVVFAATFIVVRILWWFAETVPWARAMLRLLASERCHSRAVVAAVLVANALLSWLQLSWLGAIVRAGGGGRRTSARA